jgi:diacylglycerol kinase family enzyme
VKTVGEPSRIRTLPEGAKDVLFLVNPRAGAGLQRRLVEGAAGRLRELGFRVELMADIEALAGETAERLDAGTLRAVVAVGGDGTVSLLADRTPPRTPIALLPQGTENLLAKFLGVGRSVERVCQPIVDGSAVQLDAGSANGRLFLLMAGCGFDAEVVRRVDENRKGNISHWSYVKPILDSVRSYQYPSMRVYSGPGRNGSGQVPTTNAKWVFVMNLSCYARGLAIAPEASGTDGQLDLCTFRRGSLLSGMKYLGGVLAGIHPRWTDCTICRATRLRIEADQPVPFQLDGDAAGHLPLEIEVLPARLCVLVPRDRWSLAAR